LKELRESVTAPAPSEHAMQMRREAEGGSALAQMTLGLWHQQGAEGLEQNFAKAAALFRTTADLGYASAEFSLATCYYTGEGVEQNNALAAEWGRKAADKGVKEAQFFVGDLYARGAEGLEQDLPLGKRYLELSAAQGDKGAIALLKVAVGPRQIVPTTSSSTF
jgi:TPR repeat protein